MIGILLMSIFFYSLDEDERVCLKGHINIYEINSGVHLSPLTRIEIECLFVFSFRLFSDYLDHI